MLGLRSSRNAPQNASAATGPREAPGPLGPDAHSTSVMPVPQDTGVPPLTAVPGSLTMEPSRTVAGAQDSGDPWRESGRSPTGGLQPGGEGRLTPALGGGDDPGRGDAIANGQQGGEAMLVVPAGAVMEGMEGRERILPRGESPLQLPKIESGPSPTSANNRPREHGGPYNRPREHGGP